MRRRRRRLPHRRRVSSQLSNFPKIQRSFPGLFYFRGLFDGPGPDVHTKPMDEGPLEQISFEEFAARTRQSLRQIMDLCNPNSDRTLERILEEDIVQVGPRKRMLLWRVSDNPTRRRPRLGLRKAPPIRFRRGGNRNAVPPQLRKLRALHA